MVAHIHYLKEMLNNDATFSIFSQINPEKGANLGFDSPSKNLQVCFLTQTKKYKDKHVPVVFNKINWEQVNFTEVKNEQQTKLIKQNCHKKGCLKKKKM